MPARTTKTTAPKRTLVQSSLEVPRPKKAATQTKYSFKFAHTCELIQPAEIEVVCDLENKSYLFNQQVLVVWKKVCHTGCQPPKSFDRKDGSGKFEKPAGTEFIIDNDDEDNMKAIHTLLDLNNAIAKVFEEQCKEKLGEDVRFVSADMFRQTDESHIVDISYTKSDLQIAGKLSGVAPNWLGPTDIAEMRSVFFEEFPDADKDDAVVRINAEDDFIVHINNAKAYYDKIYGLIKSRLPEPENFKYTTYPSNLVSAACTVVGARCWCSLKTQQWIIKPNLYLDRVRVYLDGERDNGDNARWCMRFHIPRITSEAASFLETM